MTSESYHFWRHHKKYLQTFWVLRDCHTLTYICYKPTALYVTNVYFKIKFTINWSTKGTHTHTHTHGSLHMSWLLLFWPKYGKVGNGEHMFESMWHALINVTIWWGICRGMHTHFACQHHCYSDLVLKWRSVKWSSICTWKKLFSTVGMQGGAMQIYMRHWVIVPYHTEELQGR